ncbi:MAG: magnesium transporter [Alphaproteobacteria bacterium]|nr:magnesium transporter [Alphaproteobacteria bacterium]
MAETASDAKTVPAPDVRGVLTPIFLRQVLDALEDGGGASVKALVDPLHAADLAHLLGAMDAGDRRALVAALGTDFDPEVLSELDEDLRTEIVRLLGSKGIADAVKELDVEDAAYVLEDLEDNEKREVLAQVPVEDRAQVVDALLFPEASAGRLMHREFLALPGRLTVAEVFSKIAAPEAPEDFQEIYVVDDEQRPVGFVALSRLLRATAGTTLSEIASTEMTVVPAVTDQKTFAYLFEHYHLNSAPVTDDFGRLVGLLSAGSVVEVLQEMHESEVLALGGVADEESLSAPILKTTRLRFSWLFVNLLTAILASIVIGFFENSLQRVVALAILMPIVASMGGNAGTQTLTIVVRALATKALNPANLWRVINRELLIGTANGIGFALIAAGVTWVWFKDPWLALVIGSAMTINMIAAAVAGILVPVGLERAGVDPAVSSPVFVTTVTDVVGFLSFLGLATWILLR